MKMRERKRVSVGGENKCSRDHIDFKQKENTVLKEKKRVKSKRPQRQTKINQSKTKWKMAGGKMGDKNKNTRIVNNKFNWKETTKC